MYYLTLGHSPELSYLELTSLGLAPVKLSSKLVATAKDPVALANKLGGTTRVLETRQTTTPKQLLTDLKTILEKESAKNVAVTNYASHPIEGQALKDIKSALVRPIRFMSFATSDHSLVALRKQHVAEYSLIEDSNKLVLAKTVWIQAADDWSYRDRQRPYQDIKRGMLPPKIARIMVNLASEGRGGTLLDPFCGTGTILLEAMLTGHSVVGSDNDPRAVEGTKNNLHWLREQAGLTSEFQVFLADATHLDRHLQQTDFVATEPYLGPLLEKASLPPKEKLQNIARGLDKLYRGTLSTLAKLLPKQGRVALVIPEFSAYNQVISTLTVDSIVRLGYNIESQTSYSQPNAVVTRQITVLTKQ